MTALSGSTQQAVEKALKVALVLAEVELPRTHDLDLLLEEVEAAGIEVPSELAHVAWLTPWAAALRYDESMPLDRAAALAVAGSACSWATDRLPRVMDVTSVHRFLLRGFEIDRKARVEVLAEGGVIGASQWVVVPAGASSPVDLALTAAPGTYTARQATNFGSNIHEKIVTNDLGSLIHPVEDAPPGGA